MQDRPAASDLLAAVQRFITETAAPRLSGQAAFHARVAGNVLDILAREMTLGPGFQKAELARLESLLGETGDVLELNRLLCDKIRAGEMDLSTPGLKEHLIRTTMGKLAIDQPKYQGYKTAQANHLPEESI